MNRRKKDMLQVGAFRSLFRSFIARDEMDVYSAFAQAIVITSDTNFEKMVEKNPGLIERWLRDYGSKKANKKANQGLEPLG